MMDLINIAELKRRIRDKKVLTHAEVEYVIDCIDGQSEAYDIDKVVDMLENCRANHDCNTCKYGKDGRKTCSEDCADALIDDLIEIVRTGGKNDD